MDGRQKTMFLQLVAIFSYFSFVSGQAVLDSTVYGVVGLRPSPADDAPLISASLNDDSGNFTISLLLYDNSTNLPTANSSASLDEDVLVYCDVITLYEDGNTDVSFGVEEVPSFAVSGSVVFSIKKQGRQVEVQCRGETAPSSAGSTNYFKNETSAGPTGYLVVKKSPVVSFCEAVIVVPNSPTIPSSMVELELSEVVVDFPVTVSCDIVGVLDANNSLWVGFQNEVVQPGDSTTVRMTYRIEQSGENIQVACSAVSEQGTQYLGNTSTGELAIFTLATGSVSLIPTTADIRSRSVTVFLVLASALGQNEGALTFFCYADPITSYYSTDLFSPTCVTPDDAFQRPTPGPAPPSTQAPLTPSNTTANTTSQAPTSQTPTPSQPPTTTPTPVPPAPTQAQSTTPGTPRRPSNYSTTPWQLREAEIIFEQGDYFKELVLTLESDTTSFDGAVLVSCCAPSDINPSPKYANISDGMVFYASIQEPRTINWTAATDSTNRFVESPLPNPAYVDLSPCPCDLTSGHCDADCCCDEDCDAADIIVFNCSDSGANQPTIYDCSSTDLYKADYWPLLCIQTSNSPYLGRYRSTRAAIRDARDFTATKTVVQTSRDTSYQDAGRRTLEQGATTSPAYSNGDPVEMIYKGGASGFLALPQTTLSGECLWTSPVKFQEDFSTRCVLPPVQTLCSQYSPLSAIMFLRPSAESYPPCPSPPGVAMQYQSSEVSPTEVEYYCLDDISEYLMDNSIEENLPGLYDRSLFPDFWNGTSDRPVPVRCLWDDGYTQPPTPQFDNDTGLCIDSVVSVSYQMFWRGGEIVRVKGMVILGAVPLMKDGRVEEGVDDFVAPPPVTEPPTAQPTLASTDAMLSTDVVTIVTDVTEIMETVFTDVFNFTTDNTTAFFIFEDINSTMPASSTDNTTQVPSGTSGNATQAGTVTTPVPALTSQAGVSAPATSPVISSAPPLSTPMVSTGAPTTLSGTATPLTSGPATPGVTTAPVTSVTATNDNTTLDVQNVNTTTDMPTDAPTTAAPINTTPLNITLHFSTQFLYLPETTNDPVTGQTIDPPEPFPRSGNPGYVVGKPLLTGIAQQTPLVFPTTPGPPINCTEFPSSPRCIEVPENETVYVFDEINDSDFNQLKVFLPGEGSLCEFSSTTSLNFGEDVTSGCLLRMGQSELQNCSILALYMQEQLRALVPADRIGKRGNSSVEEEGDWAEVFNPDAHPFEPPTTMAPTTETPADATTEPPLTTRFPGQTYVDQEPTVEAVEQLTNTCYDVPTGVNLEVLIAEAGVYSGVPQYEVLAARVTYTMSTVQLSCSGAVGVSCLFVDTPITTDQSSNQTTVQSFPIYSTVTYTKVPAQEPQPVTLYYKDHDPDMCKQDTCFAELFYPLTGAYRGVAFQYSLAISLLVILLTMAFFRIRWPWS